MKKINLLVALLLLSYSATLNAQGAAPTSGPITISLCTAIARPVEGTTWCFETSTNKLKKYVGGAFVVYPQTGDLPGGVGQGTVVSVGLAAPAQFSITNSPITDNGTLTMDWVSFNAHALVIGPTGGGAATPTLRTLVASDIPTLSYEAPLTFTSGLARSVNEISIDYTNGQSADATHKGFLTAANWSTFNSKQGAGNYITGLTGDVTATGPGSVAATIGAGRVTNGMLAGSIDLTTKVTGVLPNVNGGLGNTTGAAVTITGLIVKANTPFQNKGDLWVTDGSAMHRLGIGTNGYVVTADSTQTDGVKWAAPPTTVAGGATNDIQVNVNNGLAGGRGTLDSSQNLTLTGKVTASSFETNDTTHSGSTWLKGLHTGGTAIAAPDEGDSITLVVPSVAIAQYQVLMDNGATNCPTLVSGLPTNCHQLIGVPSIGTGNFVRADSPVFTTKITTPAVNWNTTVRDLTGTGSPLNVVTADVGSVYRQTDGAAGSILWVKESGNGSNTGWTAYGTAGSFGGLSSGTATSKTFTVGDGSTLGYSGSGTVDAKTVRGAEVGNVWIKTIDTNPGNGDDTAHSFLRGDMWINTVAHQVYVKESGSGDDNAAVWTADLANNSTPAPQYGVRPCEIVIGDPDTGSPVLVDGNDSPAVCGNLTGSSMTINEVKCYANAASATADVKIGGSSILNSPAVCGNGAFGSAASIATSTQADGAMFDVDISPGGTAKYIIVRIKRTL